MTTFSPRIIRFLCDPYSGLDLVDDLTSKAPTAFIGEDMRFDIALNPEGTFGSMSNYASLTLDVRRKTNKDATALISSTTAVFTETTRSNWDNGTAQHCSVSCAKADTNLDLGGADYIDYWLVIRATTTDSPAKEVTLGQCVFRLYENGNTSAKTTPLNYPDPLARVFGTGAITYAASKAIDMGGNAYQLIALTGNIVLSTTNRGTVTAAKSVTLIIIGDTVERNISFATGVKFIGTMPTTIAANSYNICNLTSIGATEASTLAALAPQTGTA